MYICTLYLHYLHYFLFTLFIDVYNLFYLYFLLYLLISFFINIFIFICFFCVAVFLTQCFILFVDKRVVLSLLLLNLTFSCPRSQNGDPVNDCITHEIKVYKIIIIIIIIKIMILTITILTIIKLIIITMIMIFTRDIQPFGSRVKILSNSKMKTRSRNTYFFARCMCKQGTHSPRKSIQPRVEKYTTKFATFL